MAKKNIPVDPAQEDCLEAIAEIIDSNANADAKSIAEKLQISLSAVNTALKELSSRGFIVCTPQKSVELTHSGAEKAAIIRRRHQTLQKFFMQLLKLPQTEADQAACQIEHVFREPLVSRLVALTDAVGSRSDCQNLREYLDKEMPAIKLDPDSQLIPLNTLPKGVRGVLIYVSENLRGSKKFADMGLVPGAVLEFAGNAPLGDLIRIKLMGTTLSIRSSDASNFWLRIME